MFSMKNKKNYVMHYITICNGKNMNITQHYFEKGYALQHITITFFNYPMPCDPSLEPSR